VLLEQEIGRDVFRSKNLFVLCVGAWHGTLCLNSTQCKPFAHSFPISDPIGWCFVPLLLYSYFCFTVCHFFPIVKLQTIVYFIAISYRGLGRFCLILPVIFPLLEFCLQALTSNLGYCFLNYFLLKKHVEIGMIHRFCLTSTWKQ